MATTEEIKASLMIALESGVQSKTIGNRTYTFKSAKEIYEILKKLESDEMTTDGPFLRAHCVGYE
jgi:hypothetical protein